MKKYFFNHHSLIIITAIMLLSFSIKSVPYRHGDGHEYALTTQAIVNHFYPDLRVSDVKDRRLQLQNFKNKAFSDADFQQTEKGLIAKEDSISGFYKADNQKYYGYHFWLYPGYVALIQKISSSININPLSSFQIANSILLLGLISLLIYKVKTDPLSKGVLILTFLLSGSLFYLKWTHPEFFIFTFLFLGFYSLIKNSYRIAFSCISIASIQVVSIWIVFLIVPFFIYENSRNKSEFINKIKVLISDWYILICCFLPSLSIIFYLNYFGKLSLIGDGFTNVKLISLGHLYSFFFDLDQGMIVGMPWVFLLLGIYFIRLKNNQRSISIHLLLAIFSSILIALPLLSQTSVNSGQSVFQRYALYASAPIVAWVGVYYLYIVRNFSLRIGIFVFAFFYIFSFGGANAEEDYMKHKKWTKFLLEYFPEYYNPEPGVFYARTSGDSEWNINADRAIYYKNRKGIITKILFPVKSKNSAIGRICSSDLLSEKNHSYRLESYSNESYGWAYLNGKFICPGFLIEEPISLLPQYESKNHNEIDFSKNGFPDFVSYASGLGDYESWGRWSIDRIVVLRINQNLPSKFRVMLKLGAYDRNFNGKVIVKILDQEKYFVVESNQPHDYIIDFSFNHSLVDPYIQIIPPFPTSPSSLGVSKDQRLLGLSFVKLKLIY